MKDALFARLDEAARRRLAVASRVLAAIVGGGLLAAAIRLLLTLVSPVEPAGMGAGVAIYAIQAGILLWVFHARGALRVWGWLIGWTAAVYVLCWILLRPDTTNMMPIRPFWRDAAGLLLCVGGFALLALATERESHALRQRGVTARERRWFRLLGALLLVAALAFAAQGWYGHFGAFLWFGWLSVAAVAVVFAIAYWPWRARPQRERKAWRVVLPTAARASAAARLWRGALAGGMLALPVALAAALLQAPVHPLWRAEAVRGEVGPWTFTVAEEDTAPPQATPSGVLVKHLLLRFCEACDGDIRAAYLQLREPATSRARGLRLMGAHGTREVALAIPPGVSPQERIWLTAVGKDGQIHRTALEAARVSPALARFIEEQAQ